MWYEEWSEVVKKMMMMPISEDALFEAFWGWKNFPFLFLRGFHVRTKRSEKEHPTPLCGFITFQPSNPQFLVEAFWMHFCQAEKYFQDFLLYVLGKMCCILIFPAGGKNRHRAPSSSLLKMKLMMNFHAIAY